MLLSDPGGVLLVAQERASRLLFIRRQHSKAATPIVQELQRNFALLPPALRQTVTFDNGAESDTISSCTPNCKCRASAGRAGAVAERWHRKRHRPAALSAAQKSSSEAGGRRAASMRCTQRHNHTPRKCLGFQTPAEIFSLMLLHLKCGSTPSLRSG